MGEWRGFFEMMICRERCSRGCGLWGAGGKEGRLGALPGQASVTNKCRSGRGWWASEASGAVGGKFVRSPREEGTIYRAPTRRNEEWAYRGCATASEWVGWF